MMEAEWNVISFPGFDVCLLFVVGMAFCAIEINRWSTTTIHTEDGGLDRAPPPPQTLNICPICAQVIGLRAPR